MSPLPCRLPVGPCGTRRPPADRPGNTALSLPDQRLRAHVCVLSPRSDPGTQQALSRGLVSKCRKYPRNPELLRVAPVIARLPSPPYSLLLEDRAGSGTRKQPAGPPCNETPLCVEKHKALIHTTNG